jgi:hypothetical protein
MVVIGGGADGGESDGKGSGSAVTPVWNRKNPISSSVPETIVMVTLYMRVHVHEKP